VWSGEPDRKNKLEKKKEWVLKKSFKRPPKMVWGGKDSPHNGVESEDNEPNECWKKEVKGGEKTSVGFLFVELHIPTNQKELRVH